jgi:transcriptional regulator GlxA family with amidase domain
MIDLSPSALFRSFKRATGHSPIAFLIRARMKLAIKLLEETDLQIKQIAVLVGYPDEFHFSRRFKSTIGVAPHYYRGGRLAKERSDLQNSC